MTTYAIGDVRGNFQALSELLEKIVFNPERDSLWFTGNLVGTGPDSLEVLRYVKSLGTQSVSVLGDQDLHLLAVAEGIQQQTPQDHFNELLAAPDRDELLKWLRLRPFMHKDAVFMLVHAGIPAEWSPSQVRTFAIEAHSALAMGDHKTFLDNIFADHPTRWHAKHRGWKRLRFITNAFTRMRYCDENGGLNLTADIPISNAPKELIPWYRLPERATANQNIIFGHWHLKEEKGAPGIFPLDSGCSQGGSLTAMEISSTPKLFSVPGQ